MPDVSTLFELLADVHRRRVLFALCRSESIRVPDDVRPHGTLRTAESPGDSAGGPPFEPSRQQPLTVLLHHRHLPKLADAGVVDWDRETGVVTRGEAFETVEPALRLVADNADAFPGELR